MEDTNISRYSVGLPECLVRLDRFMNDVYGNCRRKIRTVNTLFYFFFLYKSFTLNKCLLDY